MVVATISNFCFYFKKLDPHIQIGCRIHEVTMVWNKLGGSLQMDLGRIQIENGSRNKELTASALVREGELLRDTPVSGSGTPLFAISSSFDLGL
jgi:hypothetical protein